MSIVRNSALEARTIKHLHYQAPESWARAAYPHLVFYRAHDEGTHFAAWEKPQLLTEDMRETFRSVR